jgi:hypothetical protein
VAGEPIVVKRYSPREVVIVPQWEWQFLKQTEADIRGGRCLWEEQLDEVKDAR